MPEGNFSYCQYVLTEGAHPLHQAYHDEEYGFFSDDETVLFERLVLEINQAGLSWETILKKRATMQVAYDGFEVDRVASYSEDDITRLKQDPGIIRNDMKIRAAIHNAQVVQRLRADHGSFSAWLEKQVHLDKPGWTKLFKQTFKFTGGEIVNEFCMSLGYLPGAHEAGCPAGIRAAASVPAR